MIKKGFPYLYEYRKAKLKRRVRKGIPDALRGIVWYNLSGAESYKRSYPDLNDINTNDLNELVIDEIERDIDRTFPRHFLFCEKNGKGQKSLRRVLQLYAAIDEKVGYCQGMGFMAGLLLTYMVEEDAFYVFAAALQRPFAPLRPLYFPDMKEAQKILYVFGEIGAKHLKRLWVYMEDQGMHQSMYVTEWIMTMYSRGFSFDLVTRVWDIFFHEGFKIIYRVALALLKSVENEILSESFENIMALLRSLPSKVDASNVIDVAFTIPLKWKDIEIAEAKFLGT